MENAKNEFRKLSLSLNDTEQVSRVARALSVPKRVEILRLLDQKNIVSVNEIAQTLSLPISSAAMHINILEEAGLIICERFASLHGTMKMCSCQCSDIHFMLHSAPPENAKYTLQTLPIGGYSSAEDIVPACGLASQVGPIGTYNRPAAFYMPERLDAQVLWLKTGRLTYQFAPLMDRQVSVEMLEISFEACTQAQQKDRDWTAEIRLHVNGVELGRTLIDCDCEGRRGVFNPPWWPNVATQHGELLVWRVTEEGVFLRNERISNVTLNDLHLMDADSIRVTLDVPAEREHQAGINLFGNFFGDYSQALNLMIGYHHTVRM